MIIVNLGDYFPRRKDMSVTTLTQWKITFTQENKQNTVFYLSDNFYQNVMRKLADIIIDKELTNPVYKLEIERVDHSNQFNQS